MDENVKDKVILALAVACALLFFGMISSCSKSRQTMIAREKEMSIRFDAQAEVYNMQKEKTALENKLQKAQDAVKSAKSVSDSVQKSLDQEKAINQELRAEIDRLAGLNASLEEQLKNANAARSGRQSKK